VSLAVFPSRLTGAALFMATLFGHPPTVPHTSKVDL
jgi:hypothetical protein